MVKETDWNSFDKIIDAKGSILSRGIKDTLAFKDLIFLFVRRDFIAIYKQTILGPIWFFIQPLLTSSIFTLIFSIIAGISTNGSPPILFYMAGSTLWTYFSESLTKTSDTFIANQNIFSKVYFPRLVVPISVIISNLLRLGVQLSLFVLIYLIYIFKGVNIFPNYAIFLLPFLLIIMAGLGLGFGIIISSLTTKYRDLKHLIQFGVQLAMYTTPIVYPLDSVDQKFKWIILANPMTAVIETFKFSVLGKGELNWFNLLYSFISMIIILIIGLTIFNKVEKKFIDTV